MARPAGLFVTGTDTGVGKTIVAQAIIGALAQLNLDVAALKPVETGVGPNGPEDAQALAKAIRHSEPLEVICPLQFSLPAAPFVAAEDAQQPLEVRKIRDAWNQIRERHDFVVVEGAGGLLVPVTDDLDMAGLAAELELPIVIVARAALGTINHTRLTLREAERRGLEVIGVVFSHQAGPLSDADQKNFAALKKSLGPLVVGEIPFLSDPAKVSPDLLDGAEIWDRLDPK